MQFLNRIQNISPKHMNALKGGKKDELSSFFQRYGLLATGW